MNKKGLQDLLDEKFPNKKYTYGEKKHLYKDMAFTIRELFHSARLVIWRRENIEASAVLYLGEPMFKQVQIRLL